MAKLNYEFQLIIQIDSTDIKTAVADIEKDLKAKLWILSGDSTAHVVRIRAVGSRQGNTEEEVRSAIKRKAGMLLE
jgi:hypothetical protein